MEEPYKNRVFAISQEWVERFRDYSTRIKQMLRDPAQDIEQKIQRPGPIENFDLVYLSPNYQAKIGQPDVKFNDWAHMTLN